MQRNFIWKKIIGVILVEIMAAIIAHWRPWHETSGPTGIIYVTISAMPA